MGENHRESSSNNTNTR